MRHLTILFAIFATTPLFANELTSKIYVQKYEQEISYPSVDDWCLGVGLPVADSDDELHPLAQLGQGLYECEGKFYSDGSMVTVLDVALCTPTSAGKLNKMCD